MLPTSFECAFASGIREWSWRFNVVERITEFSVHFLSEEDIKSFEKGGDGRRKYPNATSNPEEELDTVSLLTRRKAYVLVMISKMGRPLPVKSRDQSSRNDIERESPVKCCLAEISQSRTKHRA